ncbi:MAG: hypothetical protein AB8H80_02320 [Planctomycetota bacterium]
MSEPDEDKRQGAGLVPIAIAAAFALSVSGGLGIALGAIMDDFPRGLAYGAGAGVLLGVVIYVFVLRDGRGAQRRDGGSSD